MTSPHHFFQLLEKSPFAPAPVAETHCVRDTGQGKGLHSTMVSLGRSSSIRKINIHMHQRKLPPWQQYSTAWCTGTLQHTCLCSSAAKCLAKRVLLDRNTDRAKREATFFNLPGHLPLFISFSLNMNTTVNLQTPNDVKRSTQEL